MTGHYYVQVLRTESLLSYQETGDDEPSLLEVQGRVRLLELRPCGNLSAAPRPDPATDRSTTHSTRLHLSPLNILGSVIVTKQCNLSLLKRHLLT